MSLSKHAIYAFLYQNKARALLLCSIIYLLAILACSASQSSPALTATALPVETPLPQEFKTNLETFTVREVIRIQQQWFKDHPDLPDIYLVAHNQIKRVKIGAVTLWEAGYFAGWQIEGNELHELKQAEWWDQAHKDLTVFWLFSFASFNASQMYVELDGVEPKRFSLDGKTNRIGSTRWILDFSQPEWQLTKDKP